MDAARLKAALSTALDEAEIRHERRDEAGQDTELWYVYGRPGVAVVSLHLELRHLLAPLGAGVLESAVEPGSGQVSLTLGCQGAPALRLRLIPQEAEQPIKGRIALLIDDFGARWDALHQAFAQLGVPLTVSVIPSLRQAETTAREMEARGCEVVLHLAMEPFNTAYRNEPIMIRAGDGEAEIRRILDQALKAVPGARGVNNHMGSKATSHRETMDRFLDEVKRRGLYFIDSRTIASTVAYEMAQDKNLPSAERQVFIDTEDDAAMIRRQVAELARQAAKRGEALGIGHCRRTTLEVLREALPRLQAEGYDFVFVSELVK